MWWGLRWLEGRLSWDTSDHSAHLPSPQKLSESRGEELEQLDPNPVPHSSLFSDIIESWNGLVRGTIVSAQPCWRRRTKKLSSGLPSHCPLLSEGWRGGHVAPSWHSLDKDFLPVLQTPAFLSYPKHFLTASFKDNEQWVPLPSHKIFLYNNQLTC